jgi:3-deoxy-7-phosphoheptulonate synthase
MGNEDTHLILRGGHDGPNYDAVGVDQAANVLENAQLVPNIMIDFSHANSMKQCHRQLLVGEDVAGQIGGGDNRIIGAMIEGHLVAGRQDVTSSRPLVYGQSITDACLGWEDTIDLLKVLVDAVIKRRKSNQIKG